MPQNFDSACRQCERLAGFLDQVKTQYPTYYAKPVPAFGVETPKLLIVGLAPGLHGANRSGRPFTGDHAGILLYETLHRYGFASAAQSVASDDALQLIDCRITNAVKCLPPENKPTGEEINRCNQFLAAELAALPASTVILALGSVAHKAILKALHLKAADYAFAHAARHALSNGQVLYDSYHCSRYNTQTKRLTTAMFHALFAAIQHELKEI
ncbi:MAG: uracil-DNA glycosylase [Methylophilaceae bacterium]|nr:uracil-DNA glycosylase [Methylophilaceae bacterium]